MGFEIDCLKRCFEPVKHDGKTTWNQHGINVWKSSEMSGRHVVLGSLQATMSNCASLLKRSALFVGKSWWFWWFVSKIRQRPCSVQAKACHLDSHSVITFITRQDFSYRMRLWSVWRKQRKMLTASLQPLQPLSRFHVTFVPCCSDPFCISWLVVASG
jgi:hypothetical protein